MARALKACPTSGCASLTRGGRCQACRAKADRDRRPDGNPYSTRGHQGFRSVVLDRDQICTMCGVAWSTVADHYPVERRDLVAQGLDPNDPDRGRGLCKPCHDTHTASTSPGGWNAR